MRTIYKYKLVNPGPVLIGMPDEATALHVGMQHGSPCVWMLVDTDKPIRNRRLWVAGTGWDLNDMPPTLPYLGTAQTADSLVWHVFDGWYSDNG